MRHEFLNQTPVPISSGPANTVQSTIEVTGLAGADVVELEVTIDVEHTWNSDLVVTLISPAGTEVVLVDRAGRSSDDFRNTIFRTGAQTSINDGRGPFRGTFAPEGDLTNFNGEGVPGTWTLKVEDKAGLDGGALNRWSLGLTTTTVVTSPFSINVRFLGGLTPGQQDAFSEAAARWSRIITGDLPPVLLNGETIDDVLIEAKGEPIDGINGVLGQAGPSHIRPGSNLPVRGVMSFDSADLGRMEVDGSLEDVIIHEMAHVLGFGTLWRPQYMSLVTGLNTLDPTFIGANAMREYGELRALADPTNDTTATPVPVANTGGSGTFGGHWREAVLGDELLTGFISGTVRPISRTSVGCFEDMGYQVDYAAADQYLLPSMLRIAEMGLFGLRQDADTCNIEPVIPVVVPPSTVLNNDDS